MQEPQPTTRPDPDLSTLAVRLLKGVLYREDDERLWGALRNLHAYVRDYVAVLGLDLVLDEAEGYAFLQSRPEVEGDEAGPRAHRLVARRQLSFPVSLLLALLRKKLAEFDASGGQTRLVLSRDQLLDMMRLFLPESNNDVRLVSQIETHIGRVVDLGFLRELKGTTGPRNYEVRRILKAFVDAQWLSDFDARLAEYQSNATGASGETAGTEDD